MNPWKQECCEGNLTLPTFVKVMLGFLFKQWECAAGTVGMGEQPHFITNFTFQVTGKFSSASC